jgi:hypothetical protein
LFTRAFALKKLLRTRGRTALATRHGTVCRLIDIILAWARVVRPLEEQLRLPADFDTRLIAAGVRKPMLKSVVKFSQRL